MHYTLWWTSAEEGKEMELLINLSEPVGRSCLYDLYLPSAYGGSMRDTLGLSRIKIPVQEYLLLQLFYSTDLYQYTLMSYYSDKFI